MSESFEGLASQDSMRAFYGTTLDRIALDGIDEYYSNLRLDMGPKNIFLEDDAGTHYEINLCAGEALEVCVGTPENSMKDGYYTITPSDSGVFLGEQSVLTEDSEDDTYYPLTENALTELSTKLQATRPALHESASERSFRISSRIERLFSLGATPEEMKLYVELFDERQTTDLAQRHAVMESIFKLRQTVLERMSRG